MNHINTWFVPVGDWSPHIAIANETHKLIIRDYSTGLQIEFFDVKEMDSLGRPVTGKSLGSLQLSREDKKKLMLWLTNVDRGAPY